MTNERQTLFKCIFSWAYYGALRVSEYTESSLVNHNLKRENIWPAFVEDDIAYKLRFDSFKASSDGSDCDYIMGPSMSHETCPVKLMHKYLVSKESRPEFALV